MADWQATSAIRVNIYAEETTPLIEIIDKTTENGTFTGLRFWLHLPVTLPDGSQAKGPFMHHPNDDDSSAVTFWGKKDLRDNLRRALVMLDQHYAVRDAQAPLTAEQKELEDYIRPRAKEEE